MDGQTAPHDHNRLDHHQLVQGLVDIGQRGIATEDDAALDAYYADDFAFHGPAGDLDYPALKSYFAALRAAFDDFAVYRDQILVDTSTATNAGEVLVAARTRMTGTFARLFTQSPIGPLPPTGQPVTMKLINIFRYDAAGRLAEEWVQTDYRGLLRQLGAEGR